MNNPLQHKPNGSPVTYDDLVWAKEAVKAMEAQRRHHPHKSTTHEERYYHVERYGTVFFRKEDDGKWYAAVVVREPRDTFVRQVGRKAARRKYFQQPNKRLHVGLPSYDEAAHLVETLMDMRLAYKRKLAAYIA